MAIERRKWVPEVPPHLFRKTPETARFLREMVVGINRIAFDPDAGGGSTSTVTVSTVTVLSVITPIGNSCPTLIGSNTTSDDTDKKFSLGVYNFDSDASAQAMIVGSNTSSEHVGSGTTVSARSGEVFLGGGIDCAFAATDVRAFTASDVTTPGGTERLHLTNEGRAIFTSEDSFGLEGRNSTSSGSDKAWNIVVSGFSSNNTPLAVLAGENKSGSTTATQSAVHIGGGIDGAEKAHDVFIYTTHPLDDHPQTSVWVDGLGRTHFTSNGYHPTVIVSQITGNGIGKRGTVAVPHLNDESTTPVAMITGRNPAGGGISELHIGGDGGLFVPNEIAFRTSAATGGEFFGEVTGGFSRETNSGPGSFWVADGVPEPATEGGRAYIYVDTSDGDLKVKFGDGTIQTIATD